MHQKCSLKVKNSKQISGGACSQTPLDGTLAHNTTIPAKFSKSTSAPPLPPLKCFLHEARRGCMGEGREGGREAEGECGRGGG